jgi:hypothetical protein
MRAHENLGIGWCVLAALAVGCGGQAASAGEEPSVTTSELPPSGFYTQTLTAEPDGCEWSIPLITQRRSMVSSAAAGFNAPLGWSQVRQDVPWEGYSKHLTNCDLTLSVETGFHDSTSLDITATEVWSSTEHCNLLPDAIPLAPCTARWREHFELEAACPATIPVPGGTLSCG